MSQAIEVALPVTRDKQLFGQPRGLATLFCTEMWERFSYYGMRALLLLYMTGAVPQGGLGLNPMKSGAIYGLYASGVYLFSLPAGWVADRLIGQRRSVFWGGVLISIGNLSLAIPRPPELFFLGLLVIAIGTGMLKPNASVIVGQLYRGESGSRRDAAFSIFYVGINLGAFIAPLIAGTVGESFGYRWGFAVAGLAMIIGLVQYRFTQHWLGDAGTHPTLKNPDERRRAWRAVLGGSAALIIIAGSIATGLIGFDASWVAHVAGAVMVGFTIAFFAWVLLFGGLTTEERKRVLVIAAFFLCSALFWAGYEQAGSTLNLFARDHTDRSWLGAWFSSGQHPVSWYQSIPPIFVLTLAPVFAWLWMALGKRNRDPSAPTKFGLGLIQLGLGYGVMMLAAQVVLSSGHGAAPTWLVLTYLLHTTGELCLSPIGLSNVTKLAPSRFVSQMMGTWFLGMALGNLAAGLIGGYVGSGDLAQMPGDFLKMTVVAVGAGIIMLLFSRMLKRLMGDIR